MRSVTPKRIQGSALLSKPASTTRSYVASTSAGPRNGMPARSSDRTGLGKSGSICLISSSVSHISCSPPRTGPRHGPRRLRNLDPEEAVKWSGGLVGGRDPDRLELGHAETILAGVETEGHWFEPATAGSAGGALREPGPPCAMQFDRHTLVLLVRPPDAPELTDEEAASSRIVGIAYRAELREQGYLVGGGPLVDQDDERLRGISIWMCDSETARRLNNEDPAVRAGRLAFEVMTWMVPAGNVRFESVPPRRGGRGGGGLTTACPVNRDEALASHPCGPHGARRDGDDAAWWALFAAGGAGGELRFRGRPRRPGGIALPAGRSGRGSRRLRARGPRSMPFPERVPDGQGEQASHAIHVTRWLEERRSLLAAVRSKVTPRRTW